MEIVLKTRIYATKFDSQSAILQLQIAESGMFSFTSLRGVFRECEK